MMLRTAVLQIHYNIFENIVQSPDRLPMCLVSDLVTCKLSEALGVFHDTECPYWDIKHWDIEFWWAMW